MMRIVCAALMLVAAGPAVAATCSPVSNDARIFASADVDDIHPDWQGDNRIGLSWSLELTGEEEGADGSYFLIGDLIDPRGNVLDAGVYVSDAEWECDE